MQDYILNLIDNYGYIALYFSMALGIIGLPITDETILAFSGFLIFQKELNLVPVVLFSFLGSITGISVSYFIGKKLGKKFLYRDSSFIHLSKDKLNRMNNWIQRYGSWLFFFGYFIPGVRHLTALIAGTSQTSYKKFAAYALPGGFLWISVFISLGFYTGKEWEKINGNIQEKILTFLFYAAITLIAVLLLINLLKIMKKKNMGNNQ